MLACAPTDDDEHLLVISFISFEVRVLVVQDKVEFK